MTTATEPKIGMAFGRDMVIDRQVLKPFLRRTNWHGVANFLGHIALLTLTGFGVAFTLDSWWVVPAMIVHGIVMAFLFAPVHECSHRTPFRSHVLNETVYWIVCLIYLVPPTFFRFYHAVHHTYTQIRGKDPDMMSRQMSVWDYLYYVTGIPFWLRNIRWFATHPFGMIASAERHYLPKSEIPCVVGEARIIMLLYASIAAVSIYYGSPAALLFWIIPRLVGEPAMRWIRIAEHGECEESPDLRVNTRTTRSSTFLRFLFWNMSFHAEHHLCSMVPFHMLSRLHQQVKGKLHPVGRGYLAVHADVLRKISRREGVTWAADRSPTQGTAD